MKKMHIFAMLFLLLAPKIFAQSADKVTELIGTDVATYGQVAYISAVSLGLLGDDATYEDALERLKKNKTIKGDVLANDEIPLSHVAFIVMRTWKIKPCLLYKAAPSPHYALRSLKANSIVAANLDPAKKSTGHEVLLLITKCVDSYETYTESEFDALRVFE